MKYMLLCDNCGTKHFTNGTNVSDLVEVKAAPLPKNANGNKESYPLPKKFKCYHCGRLFRTIELPGEAKPKETKIVEEDFKMEDEADYLKKWENETIKSVRKKPPHTFNPNS